MSEYGKRRADNITISIHRADGYWSGALIVNGDSVSEANAGSAAGVLDSIWSGAFYDDVGSEAVYTTDD